jgi:segregation and condensation protein B
MSIKAKVEAIIYATEEPVTFAQIFALVKDEVQQELTQARAAAGSAEVQASTTEPETAVVQVTGQQDTGPAADSSPENSPGTESESPQTLPDALAAEDD